MTACLGNLAKVVTFPLSPWRWIKKKGTQPFPCYFWAVPAICCTHKARQGLLRNSQLWGSSFPTPKSQRPTGNSGVVSTMARRGKKCVSGFTAIYSEPTDRIPSGRVRSTGCKISMHLNKRHVGLGPLSLALFKQPSTACEQSLRRLCSVRIISSL